MQSTRLPWALLSLALAYGSACSPTRDRETASVASDTAKRSHDSAAMTNPSVSPAPTAIHTGNSKIDQALSAAPPSIAQNAAVMDWPDSAGGQPKELRAGTNGWTCFPPSSTAPGSAPDPMCLDKEFAAWGNALMSHKTPHLKSLAVGYMLKGDAGASNTDPYAKDSTADNHWVRTGPHMMVATPNSAQLAGVSTEPGNGPWVMWKGTPYAHVMVPVR